MGCVFSAAAGEGEGVAGRDLVLANGVLAEILVFVWVIIDFALVEVEVLNFQGLFGVIVDGDLNPLTVTHVGWFQAFEASAGMIFGCRTLASFLD